MKKKQILKKSLVFSSFGFVLRRTHDSTQDFVRLCLTSLLSFVWIFSAYAFSLDDAYKDYLYGDYDQAIEKGQGLRENDQVLYFLGLVYGKVGDFSKARAVLSRIVKIYSNSELTEPAQIKFADTYFLDNNLLRAKTLYKEMERKSSMREYMPLIYLRLAQIASKEGQWIEKNKYLDLIKKNYSNSSEAKFVKILEGYGDAFYIQVGAFSNKSNAHGLKEELRNKYSVYIVEDRKGGYSLHKVRVGDFKRREDAQRIYSALLKQGYPAHLYP
jgi:tetratricopeptide (TPR) repeat protein